MSISCPGSAGNYVEVDIAAQAGASAFTLALWVYCTGGQGALTTSYVLYDPTGIPTTPVFALGNANHSYFWTFQLSDNTQVTIQEGNSINRLNTWAHLVCVFNGTAALLYVNGSLANTPPAAVGVLKNAGGIRIGSINYTSIFSGRMADLACWNRALSADEVAALASRISAARLAPNALYLPFMGPQPEGDLSGAGNTVGLAGTLNITSHAPLSPPFGFGWDMGGMVPPQIINLLEIRTHLKRTVTLNTEV